MTSVLRSAPTEESGRDRPPTEASGRDRLPWAGAPGTGLDQQGLQSTPTPTPPASPGTDQPSACPCDSPWPAGRLGRSRCGRRLQQEGQRAAGTSSLSTCREPSSPLRRAGHPQHRYQTDPSYATCTHHLRSQPPCAEGQPHCQGLGRAPLPPPRLSSPWTEDTPTSSASFPGGRERQGPCSEPRGPLPAHTVQRTPARQPDPRLHILALTLKSPSVNPCVPQSPHLQNGVTALPFTGTP